MVSVCKFGIRRVRWIQSENIDFFTINVKLDISNHEGRLVEIAARPDGKNPNLSPFPCKINNVLKPCCGHGEDPGLAGLVCAGLAVPTFPKPPFLAIRPHGTVKEPCQLAACSGCPAARDLSCLQHCPGPLSHFHGFLSPGMAT